MSLLALACAGDTESSETADVSADPAAATGATPASASPETEPHTAAETKPATRTAIDSGVAPTAPVCSARLKASLGRRTRWRGRPIPVVDPVHNLDRFFAAWRAVVDGRKRKLRIAVFGDSNTQGDWAAAFLRKRLGAQLGLGGHGFVGAGKPNKWYEHRAIRTRQTDGWDTYSVSPHSSRTKAPRGVAGLVGIGRSPGAAVAWRPAHGIESPLPVNERFSRASIHYLCGPNGGRFGVAIDGHRVRTIDAQCAEKRYRVAEVRTDAGPHRLRLITEAAPVVVFGTAFENDEPGVVVDGFGINSGNYKWLLRSDEAMFHAGLKARGYDLVILATGISMWAELDHFGLAAALIGRFRKALGDDVSILVMPPGVWGERKSEQVRLRSHIPRVVKEKRQVAQKNRTAFWNYYAAMGGKRALKRLLRTKQIYRDLLHFPPITHARMMRKLAAALDDAFAAFLKRSGVDCN